MTDKGQGWVCAPRGLNAQNQMDIVQLLSTQWMIFKSDTMSGLRPIDFRSDFSFPLLNVYSEWGLAGHFWWTCSVSCFPGDRTQTKLLSLRLQLPRWPRRILGFKDSGKALSSSSFHRENGLGPTGLWKLSLSHLLVLWPVLVGRRQSSIQGCPLREAPGSMPSFFRRTKFLLRLGQISTGAGHRRAMPP